MIKKHLEDYKILKLEVEDILERENLSKEYKTHKKLKSEKKKYNEKYTQSFHKLIRSEIMDEFSEYITEFPLGGFLEILLKKIRKQGDVEKYLHNGVYIKNSLFPDDIVLDTIYGERMATFLQKYKEFKMIKLQKNISIEPFSKKSPKLRLNPIFKNTNCFTNLNDDGVYLMIQVELPFIKTIGYI